MANRSPASSPESSRGHSPTRMEDDEISLEGERYTSTRTVTLKPIPRHKNRISQRAGFKSQQPAVMPKWLTREIQVTRILNRVINTGDVDPLRAIIDTNERKIDRNIKLYPKDAHSFGHGDMTAETPYRRKEKLLTN